MVPAADDLDVTVTDDARRDRARPRVATTQ
jgi:hypothetical protein